jgi:hypothetical protein
MAKTTAGNDGVVKEAMVTSAAVAVEETASDGVATHLKVSSFATRFCSAGRRFYPDPTLIPLDELSAEDLAEIEAEPRLKTNRV